MACSKVKIKTDKKEVTDADASVVTCRHQGAGAGRPAAKPRWPIVFFRL
jgi:hypothetical protein